MGPEIWVVVPFSRPEMKDLVLRNFLLQSYGDKKLCVVENGAGVGMFHSGECDLLLKSESHQSHARNTGISEVKKLTPDAYWASMDDDDYYGTDYLSEHANRAKRGRINGKRNSWIRFNSDHLVYFGFHWKKHSPAKSFMGGTMGAYVTDAQEFPIVAAGEEGGFCKAALKDGMEVLTTSQHNFCYNRLGPESSHTYQATEKRLWRRAGGTGIKIPKEWEHNGMTNVPDIEPVYYSENSA